MFKIHGDKRGGLKMALSKVRNVFFRSPKFVKIWSSAKKMRYDYHLISPTGLECQTPSMLNKKTWQYDINLPDDIDELYKLSQQQPEGRVLLCLIQGTKAYSRCKLKNLGIKIWVRE